VCRVKQNTIISAQRKEHRNYYRIFSSIECQKTRWPRLRFFFAARQALLVHCFQDVGDIALGTPGKGRQRPLYKRVGPR